MIEVNDIVTKNGMQWGRVYAIFECFDDIPSTHLKDKTNWLKVQRVPHTESDLVDKWYSVVWDNNKGTSLLSESRIIKQEQPQRISVN